MNSSRGALLCLATTIAIVPAAALAQSADKADIPADADDQGQILVTAGTRPEAMATFTLDRADIEARGAATLDEALRAVPGIQITSGAQGIPRIMIHGLPPRETTVFVDGVPLNPAGDGQFDPSLIPTTNIQSIRVIQGTASVLYGPGVGAGVIDIVTRTGADGLHASGRAEYGTGDAQRYALSISGARGDSGFFLSGSDISQHDFRMPGGGKRTNSDLSRRTVQGSVHTALGNWHAVVGGSWFEGGQGLPPSLYTTSQNAYASAQRFERLDDISGGTARLTVSSPTSARVTVRASGYASWLRYADRAYDDANYDTMDDASVQTFDERIRSRTEGARLQVGYDAGALGALTLGLDVQRQSEHITGRTRDVATGNGSGSGSGSGKGSGNGSGSGSSATYAFETLDENRSVVTWSTALEYRVSPRAGTMVSAGYSHHWFERGDGADDRGYQLAGGLTQALAPGLEAYVSAARKVVFPTIDQLYDPQKGNAALRPEHAAQWQAGLQWTGGARWSLRGGAFGDTIHGFIQNDRTTKVYENIGVSVWGLDIAGTLRPVAGLTLRPGYTWQRVRQLGGDVPLDYRPHHIFDFAADVSLPWHMRASTDMSYRIGQSVGKRSDATQRMDLADTVLVAARIDKAFLRWGIDVYVRGTNLFDTHALYAVGAPAPGRSLYIGITKSI